MTSTERLLGKLKSQWRDFYNKHSSSSQMPKLLSSPIATIRMTLSWNTSMLVSSHDHTYRVINDILGSLGFKTLLSIHALGSQRRPRCSWSSSRRGQYNSSRLCASIIFGNHPRKTIEVTTAKVDKLSRDKIHVERLGNIIQIWDGYPRRSTSRLLL